MASSLRSSAGFLVYAAVVLGLFLWLETGGYAFGGSRKPQRIDPKEIRSSAPGSWTYVYWAHGSRGK